MLDFSMRKFVEENQMYNIVSVWHVIMSPENCVGHPPRPEHEQQIWICNIHSAEYDKNKNFRTNLFGLLLHLSGTH